ncbi:MAG: AraC family transcriptional regulator [Parvibaculaceae bacterium]
MDALDTVFEAMRVKSVLHARLEASAPWGLSFNASPRAKFGLVARGSCWLDIEGHDKPLALTGGDCFILLHDQAFSIRDTPKALTVPCVDVIQRRIGEVIEFGGGGPVTTLISGWFEFDALGARPLLDALPAIIHTRMDCDQSRVLQSTFQLLATETAEHRLGSSLVVSRLADILFIHTIRAYLNTEGAPREGWLAALSDRQIGETVRAIHADIAAPWTVEKLAARAAMSRSAFAARFKELVGQPPMDYLVHWRMYHAATMMRRNTSDIAHIANATGYESETSFARAFKRVTGSTPGMYRRMASADRIDI